MPPRLTEHALFFFYFWKKCGKFHCAGLMRSSKLVHLHIKNIACFTWRLVQNFVGIPKEGSFLISWSFFIFQCKRLTIKASLEVSLLFVNPWSAHWFLKLLKKCRQLHCIGLMRKSKLAHLHSKILARFIWNLVQNLMNLFCFSKSNRNWSKVSKN